MQPPHLPAALRIFLWLQAYSQHVAQTSYVECSPVRPHLLHMHLQFTCLLPDQVSLTGCSLVQEQAT